MGKLSSSLSALREELRPRPQILTIDQFNNRSINELDKFSHLGLYCDKENLKKWANLGKIVTVAKDEEADNWGLDSNNQGSPFSVHTRGSVEYKVFTSATDENIYHLKEVSMIQPNFSKGYLFEVKYNSNGSLESVEEYGNSGNPRQGHRRARLSKIAERFSQAVKEQDGEKIVPSSSVANTQNGPKKAIKEINSQNIL